MLRVIVIGIFLFHFHEIYAQCPGSASCFGAYNFCSLDQLNGFSCSNAGSGVDQCTPPCSFGNAIWWAFSGEGGNASITLTYGVCIDADNDSDSDALSWGIWDDCACTQQIFCSLTGHPVPNAQTFQGYFEPCKTYYLWISGRENDICDFTISTSGGIGCNKLGPPRTVCYGYSWNSQTIYTSGTYHAQFRDQNLCAYDSIVDFTVLPDPFKPDVFYITCDNKPFVDMLGRSHSPCKDHVEISLPNTTDPFRCDSAILLTAINVEYVPRWRTQCIGGMVELSPNIILLKPCSVGETYQFQYRWYKKNDPTKTTISDQERLLVESVNENYCVEVTTEVFLFSESSICVKTFCETINEGDWAPNCFPLDGDLIVCSGKSGWYWIDTFINQKVIFHTWTVDGGYVISKIDSPGVEIKWNLKGGDTGTVCVFYDTDCGKSCEKCIKVAIKNAPDPDAGPNDSICDFVNYFKGKKDVGGQWNFLSGPGGANAIIDDIIDPASKVTVDQYGVYRFVYSESYLGCNGSDTVDLYFNPAPDTSGLTYVCNTKRTQYKLSFKVTGGAAPYKVIQGNGTIDTAGYYNSNDYDNLTSYNILIEDANGCILQFDINHNCECTNAVSGYDKTPENKCDDQSIQLTPPGHIVLDPNDTIIYVVTTDPDLVKASEGNFIRTISSSPVIFDPGYMTYNTAYYIIILVGKKNGKGGIDFSAGCIQTDGPKPFIFYKTPNPNAGIDYAICGTLYDLKGIQSIIGSDLKWRLISGSGVSISNDKLASTTVNSNGQFGTFIFELTEDNKACNASDRVSITFNPIPFIAVDEKICLEYVPPFPYQAKIKIVNGIPPFTIINGGGSINGNIYTTDTLASLIQFNVQIKDANGCISNLIIDDYNCNCGNIHAGQLDTTLTEVCIDKCVSIKNLLGEITDPEDAVIYVLHQSSYNETNPLFPKIDTFYSINDLVCFNSSEMKSGQTYYITRVVGDSVIANGKRIVMDADPCKRVTANQPVVWYPYPSPDAGPNDSVCFYNYQLNGIINSGTANWKLLTGPGNSFIADPNRAVTNVTVTGTGTYRYELSENYKGCISTSTIDVTYWDAPSWSNLNAPECDNTAEHYRITVDGKDGDRSSWIIDGYVSSAGTLSGSFIGANTWRTDWIANNDLYNLIINDRHNCLPDTISNSYECPCISKLGNLDKTPIILCIDKTAQVNYQTNSGTPDGNDVIRYMLFDGNPGDIKNANQISFNSTGNFVFDQAKMQSGKTYYIAVLMGNIDPIDAERILLDDRCLKYEVVPVTWYNYPQSLITGENTLTCSIISIKLDGTGSKSGSAAQLIYQWSTNNGHIIGGTMNNTIIIDAPGLYKLLVIDPVSQCTDEFDFIVDEDATNKPIVGIATPQLITCDRASVVLDASSSSQGSKYKINWTGPGNINNGNTYTPSVDGIGTYRLIVEDTSNGCVNSMSVNVNADLRKPIPDIKPIGQLLCAIKQMQLDASGSIGQSGNISVYNWQTPNGNIVSGLNSTTITIDKPGIYQLLVKDQNNGCDSTTMIEILEALNPLTGIQVNTQDPKCYGENTGVIDINGVITGGPANEFQYALNNQKYGSATHYGNLSQGIYQIKVKDINGCELDTVVRLIQPSKMGIQVIKSIVVNIDAPVDLETMLLNVTGGTKNYRDTTWFNLNENIDWPEVQYLADTTRDFIVTVTDAYGCQIEERVKVIVRIVKDVWWPSSFTPNGDLTNDVWNIKGKRISNIRTLNIFDRWGELVFSAHNIKDGNYDANEGWDGMFEGQKALPGVYVFYAEIEYVGSNGYDKYKGDLTLIR